jgi:hypothetical protein
MGYGLVMGFIELVQNVTTSIYSVIAKSHTLQHALNLLSLLYLSRLSPGNGFIRHSYCVHVLTGRQLSYN